MKICLINNVFKPFDRGGGAERITEILATGLQNKSYEISIICLKPYFKKADKNEFNVFYLSSAFFYLSKMPKFLRLLWHFFDLLAVVKFYKIKKILKKNNFDLVISNNLKGLGFFLPRLFKNKKIRHWHILHDLQLLHPSGLMFYGQEKIIDSKTAKFYQSLGRKLFSAPDLIISPSDWLLKIHQQKNFFKDSKTKKIPNPVILNDFKKQAKDNRSSSDKTCHFFWAGQIESHKGIAWMLEVLKKIDKKTNWNLTLAGSGTEMEKCQRIADQDKRIIFLGQINNLEVRKQIAKADCILVPSLVYENSPTIIYEAATYGKPFIASKIGGIPELAEIFCSLLFETGNEADFLKTLKYFFINQEKYQKSAQTSAEKIKKLSIENYINNLEKLLKNNSGKTI